MNPSQQLANELLELAKSWTLASLILGVRPTPVFAAVYPFTGESPGKPKSFNELSAEISTLMDYDYVPIGWILLYEYEPQQAQLRVQAFDEDAWAVDLLRGMVSGIHNSLEKRNIKVYAHQ
jgi:hypothetical protein